MGFFWVLSKIWSVIWAAIVRFCVGDYIPRQLSYGHRSVVNLRDAQRIESKREAPCSVLLDISPNGSDFLSNGEEGGVRICLKNIVILSRGGSRAYVHILGASQSADALRERLYANGEQRVSVVMSHRELASGEMLWFFSESFKDIFTTNSSAEHCLGEITSLTVAY